MKGYDSKLADANRKTVNPVGAFAASHMTAFCDGHKDNFGAMESAAEVRKFCIRPKNKLICSVVKQNLVGDFYHWGEWGYCPLGLSICGLQTYSVPATADGPDSYIKNAAFFCCRRDADHFRQHDVAESLAVKGVIVEPFEPEYAEIPDRFKAPAANVPVKQENE